MPVSDQATQTHLESKYTENTLNFHSTLKVTNQATQTDLQNKNTYSPLFKENTSDPRPFLSIGILGLECNALADSGACVSIMSESALTSLKREGLEFPLHMCNKDLAVGNGARLNVLGRVEVPISYKHNLHFITFYVCRDVNTPLILGVDFLNSFQLCSDILNNKNSEIPTSILNLLTNENLHLHDREDLGYQQRLRLDEVVEDFKGIAASEDILGCTRLEEHVIDTGDHPPVRQKYYPIPFHHRDYVRKEIDTMLKLDIIEKSNSPWNSPILLVPKANGELRMCLDSRKLNSITKVDTYPMPRVQEILDSLNNAKYMTSLDLKSAFFQIMLAEESREKTCFSIGGIGAFHFKRMPFGLVNSTARMMRLMDRIFGAEYANNIFYYVDDIILISETFEEHLSLLREACRKLRQAGLTINLEKSVFCRSSLKFLGYVVDRRGLRTDSEKVRAIVEYPIPTNQKELRRWLGLVSWYRRFLHNYSTICAPLNRLTKKLAKGSTFQITPEAEEAIKIIKESLVSSPILSVPKFDRQFIITTDASDVGLGCALSQLDDQGHERAIAYASRTLSSSERNHSTTEKELNALLFALEKFRGYVEGSPFRTKVYTDHSSLKWLVSLKSPTGRLARWALRLSQFNFDIQYKKGTDNKLADALSRAPIPTEIVNLICPVDSTSDTWYNNLFKRVEKAPHKFPDLRILNDNLYKRIRTKNPLTRDCEWKRVIPHELRQDILKTCHDRADAAHLGVFKTSKRIAQSYYWPKMMGDVKRYIRNCPICLAYKSTNEAPPGLMENPKRVQRPWQVICTDLVGPLPRSYKGYKFILVVCDCFTKYTCLFPLRNSLAKTVVEIIEREVLLKHGIPQCIIMDRGPQYISKHMQSLKLKYKIPKFFYNCRYTAQNNPAERTNRVVVSAIASYTGNDHRTWAEELGAIEFAINTAVHEVTGFSPYFLNSGREAILSGEWYPTGPMQSEDLQFTDRNLYSSMLSHLQPIFLKVNDRLQKSYQRGRIYYNRGRRHVEYTENQVVWKREYPLSNAAKFFAQKLAPKFKKCRIKTKISAVSYELKDFVTGKSLGIWHVKDILKAHPEAG